MVGFERDRDDAKLGDKLAQQRLGEPEYPCWYSVVTLASGGRVRPSGSSYVVNTALEEERTGFVEIEWGCFEVDSCKLLLGRIHTSTPLTRIWARSPPE